MELNEGDFQYPPSATTQNRAPEVESHFYDSSGPLFSMYLERAEEEDKKMAERWKGDAEGMLVFTGLFSATVATMLSISIDLQSNSQDTSAFYLANIYQLLSKENGSQIIIPSSLSNPAASFTPPTAAIWVNSLWFSSLVISLTCAILATLLQQWARRYLRVTNPRYSPHKRARIRGFFAEGVGRLHLPWTVEALTTLLHISLFLFFAGLGVFLFGIHRTVFKVVIAWVGLCIAIYACVTALPILHKDSPYHAPLSTTIWHCVTGMRFAIFPSRHNSHRHNTTMPGSLPSRNQDEGYQQSPQSLFPHLLEIAEEYASRLPAEIDYRALSWTFDSLDEDQELEQFFDGVPGFCNSSAVENPVGGFVRPNNKKLSNSLTRLMDRTLSSSLVSESVKQRRIIICTKAIRDTNLLGPWWILNRVLLGEWQAFLGSIEFGLFLKDWNSVHLPLTTFYAQCVVAVIISSVQTQARDDRWSQLVIRQIGVSKSVLRSYLIRGDSIQLANLIYIVQQTLRISPEVGEHYEAYIKNASSRTLESICKLDARSSIPELQDNFCELWNKLVRAAQYDGRPYVRNLSLGTLMNIRKVHIALHDEGTDALSTAFTTTDDGDAVRDDITSYPTCTLRWHNSTLPGGLSGLHGLGTQSLDSMPPAVPPRHVRVSSITPVTFPNPPTPSVPSAAFPVHHGSRPTDVYVDHDDSSAPHAPSAGTATTPSSPVPQIFPTPGLFPPQSDL